VNRGKDNSLGFAPNMTAVSWKTIKATCAQLYRNVTSCMPDAHKTYACGGFLEDDQGSLRAFDCLIFVCSMAVLGTYTQTVAQIALFHVAQPSLNYSEWRKLLQMRDQGSLGACDFVIFIYNDRPWDIWDGNSL